ncbi:hypothetical protein GCM10011492_12300 [Flexivirga endophytica]|uniref:YrhK domain-containing protein n=1 Tax=Flexivirga endophytica TaxID=1849103 RepID=A0A916SZ80_9MICO|nr:YrhK family protein [Flexivirga endophytica]GGB23938.1 hypothetical protein GCM10011492_12300 [Flexivirga endophytica]GHB57890.1 hypothetical protein GCM10008112_28840 [Flexivirga endophytica]
MPAQTDPPRDVTLTIGHEELRIRGIYETLSITNDFLAGVLFVVGSILFFWESTTVTATWFFLVGSVLFVARPAIRLVRRLHLGRIAEGAPGESARDF